MIRIEGRTLFLRPFVWLFAILPMIACGQKGPPLAPIVYLPRPVTEIAVKRVEDEVVLQFAVPTLNTDNSGPADLRKIEVYAHTGPLPAPVDFVKYGTLVASVDIKQPPSPEELKEQEEKAKKAAAADATGAEGAGVAGAESAPPSAAPLVDAQSAKPGMVEQGWTTSVRETLTAKHREIGPMPPTRPLPVTDPEKPVVVERLETPGTVNFDLAPQRYYTIVGVSESRNRRGPFAGPIQVALIEPLAPPEKVELSYTADVVSLMWPGQPEDIVKPATTAGATGLTAPTGATSAGPSAAAQSAKSDAAAANPTAQSPDAQKPATPVVPLPPAPVIAPLDRETEGTFELYADVETEGTVDVLVASTEKVPAGAKPKPRPVVNAVPPAPRFGYNVYEAGPPAGPTGAASADAAGAAAAPTAPVAPLNTALLTSPGFADPRVEFGAERCYVVRRVQMAGAIAIESAPSAPACVTPVDTFPPEPPKSLAHIAAANGVSLIWEANAETDLGGYLVLRGEAPGDKLSPLTPSPITDTSFLDSTVRRGRTYVYEVVAVDRSTPANQSKPSNRVEETIR